jgi:hypothetical protein
VSHVRYELGFQIPKDDILHSVKTLILHGINWLGCVVEM